MPVIPALRRLRQENHEFKASLGYSSEILSLKKEEDLLDLLENDQEQKIDFRGGFCNKAKARTLLSI
jgi:hypothetical protein